MNIVTSPDPPVPLLWARWYGPVAMGRYHHHPRLNNTQHDAKVKGLFLRRLRPEDPISDAEKGSRNWPSANQRPAQQQSSGPAKQLPVPGLPPSPSSDPWGLQAPPQTRGASKPLLRPRGGGAVLYPSPPRRARWPVGLLTCACRSHKSNELIPLWPTCNTFVAKV